MPFSRSLSKLLAARRRKHTADAEKEKHGRDECEDCGCPLENPEPDDPKAPHLCPTCHKAREFRQNRQAGDLILRGELASKDDSAPKQVSKPGMPLANGANIVPKQASKPGESSTPDVARRHARAKTESVKQMLLQLPPRAEQASGDMGETLTPTASMAAKDLFRSSGTSSTPSSCQMDFVGRSLSLMDAADTRPVFSRSLSDGRLTSKVAALGPVRVPPKMALRSPSEVSTRTPSKQSSFDGQEEGPRDFSERVWRHSQERALTALRDELYNEDTWRSISKESALSKDSKNVACSPKDFMKAFTRIPSKKPLVSSVLPGSVQVVDVTEIPRIHCTKSYLLSQTVPQSPLDSSRVPQSTPNSSRSSGSRRPQSPSQSTSERRRRALNALRAEG